MQYLITLPLWRGVPGEVAEKKLSRIFQIGIWCFWGTRSWAPRPQKWTRSLGFGNYSFYAIKTYCMTDTPKTKIVNVIFSSWYKIWPLHFYIVIEMLLIWCKELRKKGWSKKIYFCLSNALYVSRASKCQKDPRILGHRRPLGDIQNRLHDGCGLK